MTLLMVKPFTMRMVNGFFYRKLSILIFLTDFTETLVHVYKCYQQFIFCFQIFYGAFGFSPALPTLVFFVALGILFKLVLQTNIRKICLKNICIVAKDAKC